MVWGGEVRTWARKRSFRVRRPRLGLEAQGLRVGNFGFGTRPKTRPPAKEERHSILKATGCAQRS